MSKNLINKVGESGMDNLIAKTFPPVDAFGVTIPAGAGILKRGTVLALADGKYAVLAASNTGKANCVLADDVDASGGADVTAVAYRTGHFNIGALIVADGYTITAADKEALRNGGILLSEMV